MNVVCKRRQMAGGAIGRLGARPSPARREGATRDGSRGDMEACERAETGDRAWFAALDDEEGGEGGSKLVEALRSRDDDGRTAFHRACASGARGREVVRLALDRMSKEDATRVVNAVDEGEWTPLHTAAALGEEETCASLLASGAKTSARTPGGQTPGHYAASKGRVEVLEKLLSADDEWLTAEDGVGATPLHRAAARGQLKVLDFLVDAHSKGSIDVPKHALETRDKRGQTALLVACEAGQEEAVIRLAKHGANIDARDAEKNGIEELAPKLVSALRGIAAER